MFQKKESQLQSITAVIYTLLAAQHGLEEGKKTDLKRFSRAVAMAMLGAKNFKEFEQIYDQIDITVLHRNGPTAFQKHVRELLQEAKKERSQTL